MKPERKLSRSRRARIRSGAALLWLLTIAFVSCSRIDAPELYPVKGRALFRGAPAAAAQVFLHPVDAAQQGEVRPTAIVAEDGAFQVSTFEAFDGAPPGVYRLSVVWYPEEAQDAIPAGKDRLNGRFADPGKSPWTVTIVPGENDLPTLELGE